ncbi:cell envelope biogenesis protein TolA [Tardiphaga sp. 37S4]|uniref:cell envelope biogenesis protein TolA n=1 Tax=Tardiphaga sp. 37S4 TaxID=1404741 RepID=UPI001E4E7928|nr:cell envelope biogenesis protein TolA [Tardiphaga sp. 37S4]UFS76348.1 cell envelope biogenesis protein TolA [Tardiphaga sp. 37S4]
MTRKLKTYQTSIGFFDLAVAAPSMKAALDIWGADSNLFHQGFAKETDDPAIVSATIAHPGIVLRRAVGTNGAFEETSELPKDLAAPKKVSAPRKRAAPRVKAAKVDNVEARRAAAAFGKQQRKREADQRKEERARTKERERKAAQVANAQGAFNAAEQEHDAREAAIQGERDEIDKRAEAERRRWEQQREKLAASLHRVKKGGD